MATLNFFNIFSQDLAKGNHKFGSDVIKVMLTNTAPVATNAIKSDITEITAANGYSAGGPTVATISTTLTTAQTKVVASADSVVTATGAVGPFRYAVIYNDTTASPVKPLIAWLDYGSAVTMANAETFTVDFDQTNGIFTVN